MVQRNIPQGSEYCYGVVEAVPGTDPDKAGKFQVRVHGYHDSYEKNDLPWVSPMLPGTAAYNGIGHSPWSGAYGPVKGTTVMLQALDRDKTMWVAMGTTAASGKAPDGSTDVEGPEAPEPIFGQNAPSDLPVAAQTNGEEEDENNRWLEEFGGSAKRQEERDQED